VLVLDETWQTLRQYHRSRHLWLPLGTQNTFLDPAEQLHRFSLFLCHFGGHRERDHRIDVFDTEAEALEAAGVYAP
jgi:hypothetical protein